MLIACFWLLYQSCFSDEIFFFWWEKFLLKLIAYFWLLYQNADCGCLSETLSRILLCLSAFSAFGFSESEVSFSLLFFWWNIYCWYTHKPVCLAAFLALGFITNLLKLTSSPFLPSVFYAKKILIKYEHVSFWPQQHPEKWCDILKYLDHNFFTDMSTLPLEAKTFYFWTNPNWRHAARNTKLDQTW